MDNKQNIKDRLKAADFALWETVLYLDAYPNDKIALAFGLSIITAKGITGSCRHGN